MTTAQNTETGVTRTWTVLSLLEWSRTHLTEKGFEEARLHAELMLARVLGISRLDLYLQFDRPLTPSELSRYREFYRRRLTHEPLQYILGDTGFMGMTFAVSPHVLIPRPETETLVELAVRFLQARAGAASSVLDVGTGSGNIALALARLVPGLDVLAIDINPVALELADQNAQRLGINGVRFSRCDILHEVPQGGDFDLVVSNPPYIPADEVQDLQPEIRDFEPRTATTDGADGLLFLRRLAWLGRRILRPGGGLMVEIAYNQADQARSILSTSDYSDVNTAEDLSRLPRVVTGRSPVRIEETPLP
jgi:release factor glutamine methyltransferase